jgi:diaminopimelate decarboxylase
MPTTRHIDECLSVRDGVLHVEEASALDLVARFGSPLFVMSEAQLRGNVRRFHAAFQARWPDGPVDVMPAFKANTTLATRRVLTQEGAGADVYSEGELHGALVAGVAPERISVNGGGKSESLIRRCVRAGVRITVEDLDEPELIDRVAREEGRVAKVRLRVKPNLPRLWRLTDFSHEFASIDMGIQAYKSGIPAQYLPELGRRVLALPGLELVGLHVHIGRHHPSTWFWRGVARGFARLVIELSRAWGGWRPQELDLGGGFAARRDPHNKLGVRPDVLLTALSYPLELALHLLGPRIRYGALSALIEKVMARLPTTRRAPGVEAYAEALLGTLRPALLRHFGSLEGVRLQVEPGRSLYGDAGVHLTRVKKVKRQTDPVRLQWILTDTTSFFLTGGALEYNVHDFIVANRADAPVVEVADVVGHSCYADRILPFVRVPAVEVGDTIALLDTGAYQEVSASNFNALPRPPVVLVHGADAEVIRRGETLEDVYRRDVVPARLTDTERRADHA